MFEPTQATLWQPSRDGPLQMIQTTTIPLSGDAAAVAAAGRSAIGALTSMVYGGAATPNRLLVALPARDVLRKRIVLPAAAEENYRQVLAYDLDRHTPFKAEELYFDAAIVDRDAAKGTIYGGPGGGSPAADRHGAAARGRLGRGGDGRRARRAIEAASSS